MKDSKATSFNGYEYNEFGVCLNPDVAYEWSDGAGGYFMFKLSETPKGWSSGYRWHFDCAGGGGPCTIDSPRLFPSRSKAIMACAKGIKTSLGFLKAKNPKMEAELDRIIAEESGKKSHLKQYSIFDYLYD